DPDEHQHQTSARAGAETDAARRNQETEKGDCESHERHRFLLIALRRGYRSVCSNGLAFKKSAIEAASPIKKSNSHRKLPSANSAPARHVKAPRNTSTANPCVEFAPIGRLHQSKWPVASRAPF